MFNLSIQNRIKEMEKNLNNLKKDYKTFEENYREMDRYEIEQDVKDLRINLNVFMQRIRDLRGLK